MLIQRKLAQVVYGSGGGKPGDFDQFWPLPEKYKLDSGTVPSWAATSLELRNKILADLKK